jgi:hypothetical protein
LSEKVDDVTHICPEQGTVWSTKFCTSTQAGCQDMWHASKHVGSGGWEFGFSSPVIWLPAEHYTPAYNVPNDWWKEVLLSEGLRFQEQKWPRNMISPSFMKPQPIQPRPAEAASCMRACRRLVGGRCWAPNWPIFFLHFHSSFHPFCIHSHIFTM